MGTIRPKMGTKRTEDELASVLFGKTRRALLSIFYGHPDESFYLMQLVRAIDTGKGSVQRELGQLLKAGIIVSEKVGRQIFYHVNKNCPIYEELRLMVIKTIGYVDVIKEGLKPLQDRIKLAFIFGSVVKSDETSKSDVDLMIIGNVNLGEVVSAIQNAQKTLKREVNPSVYPLEEFVRKIRSGHHFLENVISNEKIFIIGDENELSRLAGQ